MVTIVENSYKDLNYKINDVLKMRISNKIEARNINKSDHEIIEEINNLINFQNGAVRGGVASAILGGIIEGFKGKLYSYYSCIIN